VRRTLLRGAARQLVRCGTSINNRQSGREVEAFFECLQGSMALPADTMCLTRHFFTRH
jgi:hypothetical protein